MSNEPLRQFHKLVREERYREARGILETAEEIDDRTAEKWMRWLHELHADEWEMVGAMSDKAKLVRNPHKAKIDHAKMLGATLGITLTGLLTVMVTYAIMSTPSYYVLSLFLLITVVAGAYGWYRIASYFDRTNGIRVGVFMGISMIFYLLSSGMPFIYFPEGPPITYWLTVVLLLFPIFGYLSWHLGEQIGRIIAESIYGISEAQTDDPQGKRHKRLR